MADINQIAIAGTVTRDPEVKFFDSGSGIAKFAIAVNQYSKKEGQTSYFLDIEAWGKLAEVVSDQVHKGNRVVVAGELKTETYVSKKTGENVTKFIINARAVDFHTPLRFGAPPKGASTSAQGASAAGEEDVPF